MNDQNLTPPKFGEIRNPNGRGKGTKNRATILKKWIEIHVKIKNKANPTLEEVEGTVEDEIVLALIAKARSGDIQAIKEVYDSLYGKIQEKQVISHSGKIKIKLTGG